MATKSYLIFLVSLSVLDSSLSLPASIDKDSVTDVHLNAVLPESDTPSLPLKMATEQNTSAPNANLELQPEGYEPSTKGPLDQGAGVGVDNPNYFSRVITSIFEIPIAVLTAVRNLIQTTAAPKFPSPQ